jgi:hypothetical protein
MNTYEIQTPSGDVLTIEASDEATAIAGAQQWFESQGKNQPTLDNQDKTQTGAPQPRAGGSIVRGWNALQDSGYLAAADAGLVSPEDAAAALAQNAQDAAKFPAPPSVAATRGRAAQQWEQGNYGSAALEYLKNPMDTLSMAGESVAPSAVGLGAGVVGGAVGGPAGFAVGLGAGSGATEYASSVKEFLQKKGVDPANPEQLSAAMGDAALMSEAREYAAKRGAVVGAFDAASGGVAGKIFSPVAKGLGGGAAGKVVGAGAELGAQSALAASGEAGAQVATEGRVNNPLAVLEEGLLEGVTGVGDIAMAPRQQLPAPAPVIKDPAQATETTAVQQPAAETAPTVETPPPPPAPDPVAPLGGAIVEELKDDPRLQDAFQQFLALQNPNMEQLSGLAMGANATQEMIPDEAQRPSYTVQQDMTDGQGNQVAGAYTPSAQNVEISLQGSSVGIMGNFVHENVHHLRNLAKGTEWARASEQVMQKIAVNARRGKNLYAALPRSVRTQFGANGQSFLEGLQLPQQDVNSEEVEAYAIQARRLDRITGTTPTKKNFIGRGLDWAVEFMERSANALAGRGYKSALDYMKFMESGQLAQMLGQQGVQAAPSRQVAPAPAQLPTQPPQPSAAPTPVPSPSTAAAPVPSDAAPALQPAPVQDAVGSQPAPATGQAPAQPTAAGSSASAKPPSSSAPEIPPAPSAAGTPDPSPSSAAPDVYQQAVQVTREKGYGSVGFLSSVLKIPREQSIAMLQKMEQDGVVGPVGVSGKRPVLQPSDQASAAPTAPPSSPQEPAPATTPALQPAAPDPAVQPTPPLQKTAGAAETVAPPKGAAAKRARKPETAVGPSLDQIPAGQKIPYTNVKPLLPKDASGSPDVELLNRTTEAIVGEPIVWGKLEPAQQREVLTALKDPQRQFSRANPTSPEFKKWWGDSKVADADGKPITVYTGTSKDKIFDKFNVPRNGTWFTEDPKEASQYAETNDSQGLKPSPTRENPWAFARVNETPRVIPTNLSIQNPYVVSEFPDFVKRANNYKKAQGEWFDRLRAEGYDGVKMTSDAGTIWVVLKDPSQIKSVYNEFKDGAATDKKFSRATPQELAAAKRLQAEMGMNDGRFKDEVNTASGRIGSWLITKGVDKHWWAEKAERAMNAGEQKDAKNSPSKRLEIGDNASSISAASVLYGAPKLDDDAFVLHPEYANGNRKSLYQAIAFAEEKGGNEGLFMATTWLAAYRAERLLLEGREKLFSALDIAMFRNLHTDPRYTWFSDFKDMWEQVNNDTMQFAVDTGYMTAEQKRLWERYGDYIPFYRMMDGDVMGPSGGKLGRLGDASKNLRGGKAQLANIAENMVRNTETLIRKSIQNFALRAVEAEFRDPAVGLLTKVPKGQVDPTMAPIDNIKQALKSKLGQQYGPIIDSIPDNPEFYEIIGIRRNKDPDVIEVRGDSPYTNDQSHVRYYRVNDPLALESLTYLPPKQSAVIRALMIPKEILTKTITSTPPYMLFNLFRDSIAAPFFGGGFTPLLGSMKGLYDASKKDTEYKNLLIGGGSPIGGFYNQAHMKKFKDLAKQDSSPLTKPFVLAYDNAFAVIDRVGEAIENANRMAIRQGALAQGKSTAEANYQALDLMRFSGKGSANFLMQIISTVPFYNAAIQSLYKLGRTGYLKGGRLRFYVAGFGMLMPLTLALESMNEDDDRYKKLSNTDKALYYHLYLDRFIPEEALKEAGIDKWAKDYKIVIPKPFEVGHAFSTIPSSLWRYYSGQDQSRDMIETMKFVLGSVFKLNPLEMMPVPIKAGFEQAVNYDLFRQRPIVPQSMVSPKQPELEYNYNTPEILKDMSKGISKAMRAVGLDNIGIDGISPLRVEKAIRDFTGNVGSMSLVAAEMFYRDAIGMPPAPKMDNRDSLLLNVTGLARLSPRADPVFTKAEKEFNDLAEAVGGFNRAMNRLKAEPSKLKEYMSENPSLTMASKAVPSVQEKLSTIRRAKTMYYYSQDPAARDKIVKLERQEADITEKFLEQYREMKKKYDR